MTYDVVHLTREGYEELKTEYENLVQTRRPEVVEKISTARDQGDLSENAAYQTAREEQAFVEGRILELHDILKRAEIVDGSNGSDVGIGSKVKVKIDGGEEEFHIVGAPEANPAVGKISHQSPLGQSLLGKKVGDQIKVDVPVGILTYTVLKIN